MSLTSVAHRMAVAVLLGAALGWIGAARAAEPAAGGAIVPKIILQSGHDGAVFAAGWTLDGRTVLTVGQDGFLLFWDPAGPRVVDRVRLPLPRMAEDVSPRSRDGSLDIAPDGRFAALRLDPAPWSDALPDTVLIDLVQHKVVGALAGRPVLWLDRGAGLLFAPAPCKTPTCPLSRIDPASLAATDLGTGLGDGQNMAVSRQGERIAAAVTVAGRSELRIWRADDLAEVDSFSLGGADVVRIGFDRTGSRVFVLQAKGTLTIFGAGHASPTTRSLARLLVGDTSVAGVDIDAHTLLISGRRFDPTQSYYCDCFTRLVDYDTGRTMAQVDGEVATVQDGRGAVVVAEGFKDQVGSALFLDTRTGANTPLGPSVRAPVAVAPDGRRFLANRQWDPATGAFGVGQYDGPPPTVMVQPIGGAARPIALRGFQAAPAIDASVSPDGRRIAFLYRVDCVIADCEGAESVVIWDIAAGAVRPPIRFTGGYFWIHWLSNDRLVLDGQNATASLFVTVSSGDHKRVPLRFARPLGTAGTVLVGAQPSVERADDQGPPSMVVYDNVAGRTLRGFAPIPPATPVDGQTWQTLRPERLALSPDGRTIAAAFILTNGNGRVGRMGLWDVATGAFLAEPEPIEDVPANLRFSPDGAEVLSSEGDRVRAWDARTGVLLRTYAPDPAGHADAVASGDGRYVAAFRGLGDSAVQVYGFRSGQPIATLATGGAAVVRTGFLDDSTALWALATDGSVRFWRTNDFKGLFTYYPLPNGRWLVIAASGRYDTNLPADTKDVGWLMPDAPRQWLAPQTFMRDYFEPGLAARLLDCTRARDCDAAFKPVPSLAGLNRVLPRITGLSVTARRTPGSAQVRVSAAQGVDPTAANGKTRSGIYDLRLFRNGKLVGEWPEPKPPPPGASSADRAKTWAADARLQAAADPMSSPVAHTFTVPLPTGRGRKVVFTAYAFNEDRVKGETATSTYVAPPSQAHARRAYLIAIGVNAYPAMPDHALRFAVNDAKSISAAMAAFVDVGDDAARGTNYVRVAKTLLSGGKVDQARKADLRAVLDILAGKADDADRRAIAGDGLDVGGLDRATPDDLVVIAFAGHGWANAAGDFYLLPSDARAPAAADPRSLATSISSAELTDWLRGVDAGEMALIIDACHSAASVAADGFKPGPMGDPGLGQLAFDKGIRILAATQADDVAQESEALGGGHGLLTYALVDKALAGGARRDGNGAIRIDALLAYVVDTMPALAASLRTRPAWLADAHWTPMLGPRDPPPAEPPHAQQPALFDFTGKPSPASVKPAA